MFRFPSRERNKFNQQSAISPMKLQLGSGNTGEQFFNLANLLLYVMTQHNHF